MYRFLHQEIMSLQHRPKRLVAVLLWLVFYLGFYFVSLHQGMIAGIARQYQDLDVFRDLPLLEGQTTNQTNENESNSNHSNNNSLMMIQPRSGVIVLGMHRSGTSMLTGVLAKGSKYETGDNLIPPRFANEKGYFERVDFVMQNDVFLKQARVGLYEPEQIADYTPSTAAFSSGNQSMTLLLQESGRTAIAFLNRQNTSTPLVPWIQKDPRMCLTLPIWLDLMEGEPAILFTYRHPLEVASSMKKRDRTPLVKGLKVWMLYNILSIKHSQHLCRVTTSNDAILANPAKELERIVNALTLDCHVYAPPHPLPDATAIHEFIDTKLQKSKNHELPGCSTTPEPLPKSLDGNGGNDAAKVVFQQAMKLYCQMESGEAFAPDFNDWPTIIQYPNT